MEVDCYDLQMKIKLPMFHMLESNQLKFKSTATPHPDLCFRGGEIVLKESHGMKSESLFHTSCYHNQMVNVFLECHKDQG